MRSHHIATISLCGLWVVCVWHLFSFGPSSRAKACSVYVVKMSCSAKPSDHILRYFLASLRFSLVSYGTSSQILQRTTTCSSNEANWRECCAQNTVCMVFCWCRVSHRWSVIPRWLEWQKRIASRLMQRVVPRCCNIVGSGLIICEWLATAGTGG